MLPSQRGFPLWSLLSLLKGFYLEPFLNGKRIFQGRPLLQIRIEQRLISFGRSLGWSINVQGWSWSPNASPYLKSYWQTKEPFLKEISLVIHLFIYSFFSIKPLFRYVRVSESGVFSLACEMNSSIEAGLIIRRVSFCGQSRGLCVGNGIFSEWAWMTLVRGLCNYLMSAVGFDHSG